MALTLDTEALARFDYQPRTRLVFGADSVDQIGQLVDSASWRSEVATGRVLLITDDHILRLGHAPRAVRALEAAGFHVDTFSDVAENPTTRDVERALVAARACAPDLFVAVGGGSTIDTAKGANFLLTCGGAMEDYWGVGKATAPLKPMIAVPTTAGTGSEVQSFALIERAADHQKMACGDPSAAPRVAVLDPTLTATQPRAVAACTGLDALTHAAEAAVTKKRTPLSSLFAIEAFRLALSALPRVLAGESDSAARGEMLIAAAYAGLAIENSMLGAAHSMANPLTAHYSLHHGQAVGMALPHVVRFNAHDPGAAHEYHRLAIATGLCSPADSTEAASRAIAMRVEALIAEAGFPADLASCGVPASAVPDLAREAARQWTAQYNPREVTARDFEDLYRAAFPR